MINEASSPVLACVAIMSCKASNVVGTSKTNGIDDLSHKRESCQDQGDLRIRLDGNSTGTIVVSNLMM
jgi:hypothetical protein